MNEKIYMVVSRKEIKALLATLDAADRAAGKPRKGSRCLVVYGETVPGADSSSGGKQVRILRTSAAYLFTP